MPGKELGKTKTFRCVLDGQRQKLIEQGREHGEDLMKRKAGPALRGLAN